MSSTSAHVVNASPDTSGSRDGIMTPRFARLLFSQFLPLLLLLPACALPLHAAEASPPRLMLATGYQDGVDASRYWVSEKLAGVRGRWDGHALRPEEHTSELQSLMRIS